MMTTNTVTPFLVLVSLVIGQAPVSQSCCYECCCVSNITTIVTSHASAAAAALKDTAATASSEAANAALAAAEAAANAAAPGTATAAANAAATAAVGARQTASEAAAVASVIALAATAVAGADCSSTPEPTDTEWVRIFHLSYNGVSADAYILWTDPAMSTPPLEVLENQYYKSPLIHGSIYWEKIVQLRVSMSKVGQEVLYVVFDAAGSDRENWFSQDRVVDSSYTDIAAAPSNIFSILGHPETRITRRFLANSAYHGCPGDMGWFGVMGVNRVCDYERPGRAAHPLAFIYCPGTTLCNWQNSANYADAFDVFAKFG